LKFCDGYTVKLRLGKYLCFRYFCLAALDKAAGTAILFSLGSFQSRTPILSALVIASCNDERRCCICLTSMNFLCLTMLVFECTEGHELLN
jgi:hypothetical protein